MIVYLSDDEYCRAVRFAKEIYDRRILTKSRHKWNRPEGQHTLQIQINTVASEIAAGKAVGVPWVYRDYPDGDGDLGPGQQVRQTHYQFGHLTVHPAEDRWVNGRLEKGDKPDHKFLLMIGTRRTFFVAGWQWGHFCQNPRFWSSLTPGRPAFNVPQNKLIKDLEGYL